MIYRHLSVDNKKKNQITEIVTQREHGATLFEIKCLNGGYDIDLTECTQAQFYGEKPDSHKVGVKCDFNEDKTAVLLPLILQMTTVPGILRGVLELSFESGNIRFNGINFKVISAPDDAEDDVEIESTDKLICGVYFYDPDKEGYPRRYKNVGTNVIGLLGNKNAKNLEIIEFTDSCFMTGESDIPKNTFSSMEKLREIRLPNSITYLTFQVFNNLPSLKKINIPNSLKKTHNYPFVNCPNLEFVKIENDFDCDGLNLGFSTKYSRETIVSWFYALKDRTGQKPYKLIIGPENLRKLLAEDIKIATDKNWTLA